MNLKKIREAKGMTQREVAECLKMKQSDISVIENGKKDVYLKTAVKIADYLGITLDELVKGYQHY